MASDYEAITRYNERQLGLDTASRKTQICMYSDSTHFVYEILQNADDYGATKVLFILSKDKLFIAYNGEPFKEENVKAITYFGKSTSRDDLVKTGRFGVGFKSVFAFTSTPIIISDHEHFQIYGLYHVREYPYLQGYSRAQTRIILPFNHESEQPDYVEEIMSPEEAYSKISTRLNELNFNTMLFTKNVREIHWKIDDYKGFYSRKDENDDNARWTTITNGKKSKRYLVFSRIPKWNNQEYKAVEIAFAVHDKDKLSQIDDFLFVLFSTTQETHLQFILNGPYRTNPSRETISENDNFNLHLMKETCELMKNIFPQLKKMGILTTQFLTILPNYNDKLGNFYKPLYEATIESFHDNELIPTDDNKYASADKVFQGPSRLREVITRDELSFFVDREAVCWAKGVQQNSRADYFLQSLDIQQWGWKQLQEVLQDKYLHWYSNSINEDNAWLVARSDIWLQKLYMLLGEAIKKDECSESTLRRCRIIRVLFNGKITHIAGSDAYFPKRGYRDLPQVKRTILCSRNQKATQRIWESLVALGVSEISDEERIDLLLKIYHIDESVSVTTEQHLQHMKAFIKWWKKEKDARKFKECAIFLSIENKNYHMPLECFLDSPLRKSGLQVIYSKNISGIPNKEKLWIGYRKLVSYGFCDFAIACGVADRLSIEHQHCLNHPMWPEMKKGLENAYYHSRTGINDDYYIPNLKELLKLNNRETNLLIWNSISKASPEVFEATYRPNQQYETRRYKSSFVLELSYAKWIPDKIGHLHKPCDMTKEKLHHDFKYDNRNGWLNEIGFGENAKKASEGYKRRKEMASFLGVPVEIADYLSSLSEEEREKEIKEFKTLIKRKETARKRAKIIQQKNVHYHEALSKVFSVPGSSKSINKERGEGLVGNPIRRREKISEDIANAIGNEGKSEDYFYFSLRKKWKGKNDQVRVALKEWYGGRCQICDKTFIQRSGEPYFEGLYLVPYTTAEWLDRVGNVLCLCPLHSAMFQFGPKEVDEDIVEQILRLKVLADGGTGLLSIKLRLCKKEVEIKFSEKHLIDLQEMLKMGEKE